MWFIREHTPTNQSKVTKSWMMFLASTFIYLMFLPHFVFMSHFQEDECRRWGNRAKERKKARKRHHTNWVRNTYYWWMGWLFSGSRILNRIFIDMFMYNFHTSTTFMVSQVLKKVARKKSCCWYIYFVVAALNILCVFVCICSDWIQALVLVIAYRIVYI